MIEHATAPGDADGVEFGFGLDLILGAEQQRARETRIIVRIRARRDSLDAIHIGDHWPGTATSRPGT